MQEEPFGEATQQLPIPRVQTVVGTGTGSVPKPWDGRSVQYRQETADPGTGLDAEPM